MRDEGPLGTALRPDNEPPPLAGTASVATLAGTFEFVWASATHRGNRRPHNEDAVCTVPPVFLVADGMGGHRAGDIASALAIGAMSALRSASAIPLVELARALLATNRLIRAKSGGGDLAMGTTLTGIAVADGRPANAAIINVGDSRTYLYADGVLTQVTHDHSQVQELVDGGYITEREARTHPERHVVTRALGIADHVSIDVTLVPLAVGQRWFICSDGLSGELEDDEIRGLLAAELPADAAAALVNRVLAGVAADNVSVVVVDVVGLQPLEAEGEDPATAITLRRRRSDAAASSDATSGADGSSSG